VVGLSDIEVQEEYEAELGQYVEVVIRLSNGQRRWCIFATAEALAGMGDPLEETEVRLLYGVPHVIVVTAFNREIIRRVLHYIDRQGELLACTKPLEE
jgi:hypothetical protein